MRNFLIIPVLAIATAACQTTAGRKVIDQAPALEGASCGQILHAHRQAVDALNAAYSDQKGIEAAQKGLAVGSVLFPPAAIAVMAAGAGKGDTRALRSHTDMLVHEMLQRVANGGCKTRVARAVSE